jgi:hypothetical protein
MPQLDEIALYATEGCHLCDIATVEIQQALIAFPDQRIAYVDIVESDDLVTRYGERIPVLVNETHHAELGWPFTAEDVQVWLKNQWAN